MSTHKKLHIMFFVLTGVLLVAVAYMYIYPTKSQTAKLAPAGPSSSKMPVTASSSAQAQSNVCAGNTTDQEVIISISKRHLWVCNKQAAAYDSAVITGMQNLPADLTPTGTYHIYAKQTDLYLDGSDSTGKWHDYVNYWMPFLSNKYGIYGFHDATWRESSDFGSIDPYSSNASHGCVELPLATAKWLYEWAPVGTVVTIKS